VHDPGLQVHAAQVLIAEIRPQHGSLPDRQALRLIGRSTSRPPRISWPPALRSNPAQAPLADRARQGRRPTKGTYFAAHFAQLRGRLRRAQSDRRHPARNPGRLFHIVRDQVPFRELGPGWQRKRYSAEHRARRLQPQLQALGYTVTRQPAEAYEPTA
jgi:hypothetical protein